MEKEKQIKLSAGSEWHYHLLKFTFGIEPTEIVNLCLYFWLTVASIFVCPFVAFYKLIKTIVMLVGLWIRKTVDIVVKQMEGNEFNRFLDNLTKGEMYFIFNFVEDRKFHSKAECSCFDERIEQFWKSKSMSYTKYLKQIIKLKGLSKENIRSYKKDFENEYKHHLELLEARRKKAEQDSIKEENRKKNLKKRMSAIASFTKNVFTCLSTLGCVITIAFLSNALTDFLIYIFHFSFDWAYFWLAFFKAMCTIVPSFACSILIVWFIYTSENKLEVEHRRWYENVMVAIYKPIRFFTCNIFVELICVKFIYEILFGAIICGILSGFREGFNEFGGIFGEYLSASYNDYCPGIEWEK